MFYFCLYVRASMCVWQINAIAAHLITHMSQIEDLLGSGADFQTVCALVSTSTSLVLKRYDVRHSYFERTHLRTYTPFKLLCRNIYQDFGRPVKPVKRRYSLQAWQDDSQVHSFITILSFPFRFLISLFPSFSCCFFLYLPFSFVSFLFFSIFSSYFFFCTLNEWKNR